MQQLALKASRLPSLFRSTSCTIDDILMDIASVFQIWSQLAGNEELVRIWANQKRRNIRSIILLSLNDWQHTWSNTQRYTETVSAEADVII